jgi:hypothetical protein
MSERMRGSDPMDIVLEGLDPDIRAQAAAAAADQGISLEAYLSELLLEETIEAMGQEPEAPLAPELAPEPPAPTIYFSPEPTPVSEQPKPDAASAATDSKSRGNIVIRHRLDALERRIAMAVGSLDHAISTVDTSVLSLAERVDEQDAAITKSADGLAKALHEVSGSLAAVRAQLAQNDDAVSALNAASTVAHVTLADRITDLDQRLSVTDDIARDADRASADAARAHEAMKASLAAELRDFTRTAEARSSADLAEVRTAAIAAANHADESAAHVLAEMRALRETVEGRLAETAAETQARMHAAFADSVELVNALNSRVAEHERDARLNAESMRARLIDIEDASQTAIEATAETLRTAHSALAIDVARLAQDARGSVDAMRVASETLRSDVARDIHALQDSQAGTQARLKLVDSAIANAIADMGGVRDEISRRAQETAAQARQDLALARDGLANRIETLATRMSDSDALAAEAHKALAAETHRVEACTIAALEKSAQDRAALENVMRMGLSDAERARASMEQAINLSVANVAHAARAHADEGDQRINQELAAIRNQRAGLQSRIDAVASKVDGELAKIPARLGAIESSAATHLNSVDGLRAQMDILSSRIDSVNQGVTARFEDATSRISKRFESANAPLAARVEEAHTRIAAHDSAAAESAEHVRNLARIVDRLSAQTADTAAHAAERLQDIEIAVADLSVKQASGAHDVVAALTKDMLDAEQRHSRALDALRRDIALFLDDSDARMAKLETTKGGDLAQEFSALHQNVEDRLAEAERRSVRALEQVMETVALLRRRFNADDGRDSKSA